MGEQDQDEWVVSFHAEPFTLHLNMERDLNRDRKNGLCTHFSGPEAVSGGVF